MQTLRTATAVFTLSPTRNVGELQAKLAKCNGKYKPTKIKADKRFYPVFVNGMSTADYVAAYHYANTTLRPYASVGSELYRQQAKDAVRFFAPLNTEPCTLYTGEDSFETIEECEVIEFPSRIDARELSGAELDAAYAEFAFAA